MPWTPFTNTIAVLVSDGPVVSNTSSEQSLLPHYSNVIFPQRYFDHLGQTCEAHAFGSVSGIAPASLTFRIKLGDQPVAESQSFPMPADIQVEQTWYLRWWFQLRSTGISAGFMHAGLFSSTFINTPIPNSGPRVGALFDATVQQPLDITAQWDSVDPVNSVQMHLAVLKMLN